MGPVQLLVHGFVLSMFGKVADQKGIMAKVKDRVRTEASSTCFDVLYRGGLGPTRRRY